eukprot:PRCOL_00000336-RA
MVAAEGAAAARSALRRTLRAMRARLAPAAGGAGGCGPWRAHAAALARAGAHADGRAAAEYADLVEDTHALKDLLRSYNIGRGEEVQRKGHLEDTAAYVGLKMPITPGEEGAKAN